MRSFSNHTLENGIGVWNGGLNFNLSGIFATEGSVGVRGSANVTDVAEAGDGGNEQDYLGVVRMTWQI